MDKERFDKWLSSLSPEGRVRLAKEKLPNLVDHLLHVIALHANNEIISYSSKLSSQIPNSRGANAFNITQYALHRFELIRTCAVWDSADPDKENIATIVALVDDTAVISLLTAETAAHWGALEPAILNPAEDKDLRKVEEEVLRSANETFGKEMAERDGKWLAESVAEAKDILASDKLLAVMNIRDKKLAHSLAITSREKRGVVPPMKYGYEKDLLEAAIRITEKLYCSVNGISFDFEGSWEISRESSAELWDACRFEFKKT